jgi:hypothetical protein
MENDQAQDGQGRHVAVPIKLASDDDVVFPLVNNVWFNFDSSHIYMRLYQVVPPLAAEGIPNMVAGKLVSAVAIPATWIPLMIKALQDIAKKYEQSTGVSLAAAEEEA